MEIKPKMAVVCSKNGQFGVIDRMENPDTVRLAKDNQGRYHYFPLSWVKSVDALVHLDRSTDQAMREWSAIPPPPTTRA